MEVELKLLVAPEDLARVERHPALKGMRHWAARREHLATVYYDTPDFALAREGVALRVRRSGERSVQTLKAEGLAAAGLHSREELEWPLAGDEAPDLTLLDETPYRALFARKRVRERLQPVFTTEFDRAARMVAFADGTAAELAIDRGEIRAGERAAPISEAEIELKTGDAHRLFALAREIARDVPIRLGHASKAERGYALASGAPAVPQKARPVPLDGPLSAGAALRSIAFACIAQMQANEDGLLDRQGSRVPPPVPRRLATAALLSRARRPRARQARGRRRRGGAALAPEHPRTGARLGRVHDRNARERSRGASMPERN